MNSDEATARASFLQNYPLWSLKRFKLFLKYSWNTAKSLTERTGGGRIKFLLDMIWCDIRYGAMDSRDYLLFEFYKKSSMERNTFFTKRRYFRLIRKFDKATFSRLLNKAVMYEEYSEFIGRRWNLVGPQNTEEEIRHILKSRSYVLIKPLSSEQGHGIYKLNIKDSDMINSFIQNCRSGHYLIEDVLANEDTIGLLNPNSLNTVRVFTLVKKDQTVEIIDANLRAGVNGCPVDNWGSGGIGYHINLEHGIIDLPGVDKKGNRYVIHPGTNIVVVGYHIPYWNEIKKFAIDIINKNKKVVYAGLDIAITPEGPKLVEINFPGGHDFLQSVDEVGKFEKIRSIYE